MRRTFGAAGEARRGETRVASLGTRRYSVGSPFPPIPNRFGTFLGNTECERISEDYRGRTHSLWSYLAQNKAHLTSPFYDPQGRPKSGDDKLFLPPLSTILRRVKVWEYFLQKSPKETLAGVPER